MTGKLLESRNCGSHLHPSRPSDGPELLVARVVTIPCPALRVSVKCPQQRTLLYPGCCVKQGEVRIETMTPSLYSLSVTDAWRHVDSHLCGPNCSLGRKERHAASRTFQNHPPYKRIPFADPSSGSSASPDPTVSLDLFPSAAVKYPSPSSKVACQLHKDQEDCLLCSAPCPSSVCHLVSKVLP